VALKSNANAGKVLNRINPTFPFAKRIWYFQFLLLLEIGNANNRILKILSNKVTKVRGSEQQESTAPPPFDWVLSFWNVSL